MTLLVTIQMPSRDFAVIVFCVNAADPDTAKVTGVRRRRAGERGHEAGRTVFMALLDAVGPDQGKLGGRCCAGNRRKSTTAFILRMGVGLARVRHDENAPDRERLRFSLKDESRANDSNELVS